ncbi:MAG: DUF1800 family protein [Planctomycetes bacterium]|nr:DUF1800 family protein [Planctomycetota bacterium]
MRDKSGLRKAQVEFRREAHDDGAKVVLGVAFPAGQGERDAHQLLDVVARHPSTARPSPACALPRRQPPPRMCRRQRATATSARRCARSSRVPSSWHEPQAARRRQAVSTSLILRATDASRRGRRCAPTSPEWATLRSSIRRPMARRSSRRHGKGRSCGAGSSPARRPMGARATAGLRSGEQALLAHVLGRAPSEHERRLLVGEETGTVDLGLALAAPSFQRF